MNPNNSLPVIIVSACDKQTAEAFMSELIDDELSETEGEHAAIEGRVWRLVTKYYRADVEVRPCGDADPPPQHAAEGHVAYFTPQECRYEATALEALAEARARAGRGAAVRVLALRCERVPAALAAWAPRARCEPAALLAPSRRGPFAPPPGVARVRAALHAHPWRNLARLDRPDRPHRPPPSSSSSSGGSGAEDEDEDDAAAVERAEQFARALSALGDAGGAARGAGAGEGDAERLARAEQLVAAFCRALGHDLDAC